MCFSGWRVKYTSGRCQVLFFGFFDGKNIFVQNSLKLSTVEIIFLPEFTEFFLRFIFPIFRWAINFLKFGKNWFWGINCGRKSGMFSIYLMKTLPFHVFIGTSKIISAVLKVFVKHFNPSFISVPRVSSSLDQNS